MDEANVVGSSGQQRSPFILDGHNLDIEAIIAIAKHAEPVQIAESTRCSVQDSVRLLQESLDQGRIIYGVNTGFGGSANTRTKKVEELQATLIREHNVGVLADPAQDGEQSTCMPETWVRASIVVRINSLASGCSGVRSILIENLAELLMKNITPRVPLRCTISASGDLVPLSYLAATLQGRHDIQVWAGDGANRQIMSAAQALSQASIVPITLGPKEGLGIINGTGFSAGVGALAIHDAEFLSILSQLLTSMSVESLRGTTESFDNFFDTVRPHPGQREVARNIRSFLANSRLSQWNDGREVGSLRQDRYTIRTAPQWLGPAVEDLQLARSQVTIECNSVTDNPLIDTGSGTNNDPRILHGGNFQAKAITSAMEKTRLALHSIGQMLFAQCTEILNPAMNYGLPPNLAVDEPSESFLLKSVDIMVASLQSELGFLANPVGIHVQSAEMGNQSLNSLALISARYTHTAVDVLSQLEACHLLCLCQVLDLRAMHSSFLDIFEPLFRDTTVTILGRFLDGEAYSSNESGIERDKCADSQANGVNDIAHGTSNVDRPILSDSDIAQSKSAFPDNREDSLHVRLWTGFRREYDKTTTMDSDDRFPCIFRSLQPIIIDFATKSFSPEVFKAMKSWTRVCSNSALDAFRLNRVTYLKSPNASPLLGDGSQWIYNFVREELDVPFLSKLTTQQDVQGSFPQSTGTGDDREGIKDSEKKRPSLTIGGQITRIHEAIRDGRLQRSFAQWRHVDPT